MNYFQRYKELYNKDLEQYKDTPLLQSIRINTLKISAKELLTRLSAKGVVLKKNEMLDFGYQVMTSDFSLASTPEYLMGYFYIQEAASQMPVQLLRPSPGDLVLDMAAAPGGKTTQIAQYMKNEGVIIALDTNKRRLLSLKNNINRLGVSNVLVYLKDARYASDLGQEFDCILLDAPCSGNFAADKEWGEKERSTEDFLAMASLQKQLLKSAVGVLKTGGRIVYSTCSLEPEEGENVIEWAKYHLPIQIKDTYRYFPPQYQGFYSSVLIKA